MRSRVLKIGFKTRNTGGRKNLWASMIACLACLAVLSVLIADLFAAGKEEKTPSAGAKLKVVEAESGRPKLVITPDGDLQKTYEVLPNAVVELNGKPASIVTITLDDEERITAVSAERFYSGVLFSAKDGRVEVTTDFTDMKTYKVAVDALITLNGETVGLEQLARGDLVKVAATPTSGLRGSSSIASAS